MKSIKPGQKENVIWGDIVLPRGRRRGRPVLRDSDKAQARKLKEVAQLRAENASLQQQLRELNNVLARLSLNGAG